MKILQIIPTLQKGGAERLCLDICNTLQKKETHQVQLINFHPTNAYPFLTENIDRRVVPSLFIPSLTGKNQIQLDALQKAIDSFQPEVIHLHLFESLIAVSQLTHNAHLIVHFHDNMVQFENFSWRTLLSKRKFTNFFEKRIVLRSIKNHKVTCVGISTDTYSYLKRVLPKPCNKIKLLNAIDTNRFYPLKTNEEANSTKKGSSTEITMIGSLVDNKNQALAIKVVSCLKDRGYSVKLNLLGEGPMRGQLEGISNELKVHDLVKFRGNVDFPEKYLWRSSIYIHTSKSEAFGLTLLEAMAAGLPVVCTDGRGNRDLMKDGENGFLIYSRNPEELADKVQYLVENDEVRESMGVYAQDFAQNFDIEKYTKQLIKLYSF